MHISSEDNIYPVGTLIRAKVNPGLPLIIDKYYRGIYYCVVVGNSDYKCLAYFERELIPPPVSNIMILKKCSCHEPLHQPFLAIIIICLQEVIDNIYRMLSHAPTCQSRLSFASAHYKDGGPFTK